MNTIAITIILSSIFGILIGAGIASIICLNQNIKDSEKQEFLRNSWKYSTLKMMKSYVEMLSTSRELIESDSYLLGVLRDYIKHVRQFPDIDMQIANGLMDTITVRIEEERAGSNLLKDFVAKETRYLDNQINELIEKYSKEQLEEEL